MLSCSSISVNEYLMQEYCETFGTLFSVEVKDSLFRVFPATWEQVKFSNRSFICNIFLAILNLLNLTLTIACSTWKHGQDFENNGRHCSIYLPDTDLFDDLIGHTKVSLLQYLIKWPNFHLPYSFGSDTYSLTLSFCPPTRTVREKEKKKNLAILIA